MKQNLTQRLLLFPKFETRILGFVGHFRDGMTLDCLTLWGWNDTGAGMTLWTWYDSLEKIMFYTKEQLNGVDSYKNTEG